MWSGLDLIAHSAVEEGADQVFGVKVRWEAELDPTGFIQCLQLLGRQRKLAAREVVLKLRKLARADMGMTGTGRERSQARATCAMVRPV